MSTTLPHSGLPTSFKPFDIIDLVGHLRSDLNLRDEDVAYLRTAFHSVRASDFQAGRICAFWTGAGKLADRLGVSPRHLSRIEDRLAKRGLIQRTWPRNGRRFGQRSPNGQIIFAGGVNLGPLIDMLPRLLSMVNSAKAARNTIAQLRDAANVLIKKIRAIGEASALLAARKAFPRLRPSEITNADRLREINEALEAVLSDFCPNLSRTSGGAVSDSSVRPITEEKKNTKICTDEGSRQMRPIATTPHQVWLLASDDFRDCLKLYAAGLGADNDSGAEWRCICFAARDFASTRGIHADEWLSACNALGAERAALCLTIVDHNASRHDRWQVRNIRAAFSGIVAREVDGQSSLHRLCQERLRDISRRADRA
jgi:replication initiation protein RepC